MALKSSRVVSSSSCPVTTTAPVTISCPPTTFAPTAVSPAVAPTAVPTTDISALLAQLGLSPTATAGAAFPGNAPQQIFSNPATALGATNPLAALAAVNPAAALAFLSPALGIFNPAINPNAGLLAFNPAGAPTQALSSKSGKATLPFGKFPFGI